MNRNNTERGLMFREMTFSFSTSFFKRKKKWFHEANDSRTQILNFNDPN